MKKTLIILLLISCLLPRLFAQSPTTSFDVDGIKVIFKPTVKDLINVRMYYRGGVTNYHASQAGIEGFALQATIECGTKSYAANTFKDKADKYGIIFDAESDFDYGDIDMECVSKYFDTAWGLFADAIVNPVFDNNEVELLRTKLVGKIRQQDSDPDKHAEQLMIENAFAGTPYATDPDGTEDVVGKLSANDLKNYYNSVLNKNQLFIVVAGKITKEELIKKIHASFSALPSKPYTPVHLQEPIWDNYKLLSEPRDLQTNYINAIMNSPPVTSEDYLPYRIGISVLGGALFSELRTELNLSYDPGAASAMHQMPYAFMYISTTDPKAAVSAMMDQLNIVKNNGITEEGLKRLKSSYFTTNYIKQQSSAAITSSLGSAEALGGWKMADDLAGQIAKVTVPGINKALLKYIVGVRWSYLGNAQQAAAADSAFKKQVR
jgi:zinc protease